MTQEKQVREDRRVLVDAFRSNSSDKDKVVVSVSGAALAVSIAFLRDSSGQPISQWLLILALIGFGVSLGSVLLAFDLNSRQIERTIRNQDTWLATSTELQKPEGPADGGYVFNVFGRDWRVVNLVNTASVYSLVTAVGLTIGFLITNLD